MLTCPAGWSLCPFIGSTSNRAPPRIPWLAWPPSSTGLLPAAKDPVYTVFTLCGLSRMCPSARSPLLLCSHSPILQERFPYYEGQTLIFINKATLILSTQSQDLSKMHMAISTLWRALSCLCLPWPQTLPLCTSSHLSELEKPEETLPIFMSLRLKWLRRSRLGDRTVGGGRAGLGQRALLGQGAVLLGQGALLLRAGCRGGAVELCNGEPKGAYRQVGAWEMMRGGPRWSLKALVISVSVRL